MEDYDSDYDGDGILKDLANELECVKYKKTDLRELTCFYMYVDNTRALKHVEKSIINLEIPNTVMKYELQGIIKNKQRYNEKNYKLIHLFKYNFNIDESEVKNHEKYNFLENQRCFRFFVRVYFACLVALYS